MLLPIFLIAAGVFYLLEKEKTAGSESWRIRPFPGQNDDSIQPVVQTPSSSPDTDDLVVAKAPTETASTALADGSTNKTT
jgi:hypothetical protein